MRTDWVGDFIIGFTLGILIASIMFLGTTRFESTIVKHKECAYFHPTTKELVWRDEDGDIPDQKYRTRYDNTVSAQNPNQK